jgi:hypothetical protein
LAGAPGKCYLNPRSAAAPKVARGFRRGREQVAEMQDEEQAFTVRDRRIAHDAGDDSGAAARPEPAPQAPPGPPPGADPKASQAPSEAASQAAAPGAGPDFSMAGEEAGIDFSAFVFSLARTALIHLGLERHPETGDQAMNLDAARETIDVLGMLEEKTRGNLTPEEAELISKMLYTLRLSFVEVSRAGRPG